MKSMTGFAQGRFNFEKFSLSIKFRSVNHRFLDISFRGTGVSPSSEKLMRDLIKGKLFRGKVEVVFDLFEYNPKKWHIQFNDTLLAAILDKLVPFQQAYQKELSVSLDSLLKIPMIFHLDYVFDSYNKKDLQRIRTSFRHVFEDFLRSRNEEGAMIFADLLKSCQKTDTLLIEVESEAGRLEKDLFNRYKTRIDKLLQTAHVDERRIAQEAAIAADRVCIAEEINRLRGHSKRLQALLRNKKIEVKGKEADFLSQEMQRETYTIASKTGSADIHDKIIKIRREIEKIRQQVQNVE